MKRREIAWILTFIVEVAYVAWGGMAAAMPDGLLGPGGKAILPAGYEGFSNGSWPELLRASPMTAQYMVVLFRMYGIYCVLFGLMAGVIAVTAFRRGDPWAWWTLLIGNTIAFVTAMRYDWIVNAIGPFELTEYLGLAMIYGALAVTAPFLHIGAAGSSDGLTMEPLHLAHLIVLGMCLGVVGVVFATPGLYPGLVYFRR
jgi:hypothetical protein